MTTRSRNEKVFISALAAIVLASYLLIASIGNTDIYSLTRVLTGKNISCNLQGINFSKINKPETSLAGADLEYAILTDANMSNSNFTGAFMRHAILSGANLQNSVFRNAVLNSSELINTDLRGADLRGAYLADANLTGALVTESQLKSARTLTGAILPNGQKHD